MRKIAHWIDRPRYSIAENAQGDPVALLIPLPIESYQQSTTPLRMENRTFNKNIGTPAEMWFKNYHGPDDPDGAA